VGGSSGRDGQVGRVRGGTRADRPRGAIGGTDGAASHVSTLAVIGGSGQRLAAINENSPAVWTALAAFDDLAGRDALAVLAIAPTPAAGRRLRVARVEKALRAAGSSTGTCRRARSSRPGIAGCSRRAPRSA
jgi:hypothetical protein